VCRLEIRRNRSPRTEISAITSYSENRYFAYIHQSILFAPYVISVLFKRILTTVVCCHTIPCYLEKCTEASEKPVAFVVRVGTGISRVHQSILFATEISVTSIYIHQTSQTHIHRDSKLNSRCHEALESRTYSSSWIS